MGDAEAEVEGSELVEAIVGPAEETAFTVELVA